MSIVEKLKKFRYSVQFKFVSAYFLLIAVLMVILNIYPVVSLRNMAFTSKQSSMQSQAAVISSSLAALEELTEQGTDKVMQLMDVTQLTRVLITDSEGKILYDTSEADSQVGHYALLADISRALGGKVVFYSNYNGTAFMSRISTPVVSYGKTIGAAYLYEYDSEQAGLISGIKATLRNFSIVLCVLALALSALFTFILTGRITELSGAIRIVSDGRYDYRLRVKGRDEISELASEFNELTSRLQSTEEMRRRFVSDASHELKTPLASIRLLTDSIVQSDAMDIETMREFVTDIGTEAERLQRTTEKLLGLTRLDSTPKVVREKVDLKRLVKDTIHILVPLASEGGITIDSSLSDGCTIMASPDDIQRVIYNLTENAIKYNTSGGSVTLSLARYGDMARITVDDTGIGIPEEDMPNIFTRFYRVDKARSRASGGSGLGLSIVHDTVILYGGSVKVEQRAEGGSRFTVEFPLFEGQ